MRLTAKNYPGPGVAGFLAALVFVSPVLSAEQAPIPDLSGTWGRDYLFFEPPSSGPGPIVSMLKNPDGTMARQAGFVGDYTSPILKPEAADVVRKRGEIALSGAVPTPSNQCGSEPTPYVLGANSGLQVLQQKNEVILLYVADHGVRHIRMNAPHPPHFVPTWHGDSVGHYEGDTLVIDTVGLRVGPLSVVDMYGTPFSAALHVVERYRLIDGAAARDAQRKHDADYFPPGVPGPLADEYGQGNFDPDASKGLQVEFTVEDPGVFTVPWSGVITYRRRVGELPEMVCAENTREYYANRDTDVPRADKPDF
jgi:hypothetical protein